MSQSDFERLADEVTRAAVEMGLCSPGHELSGPQLLLMLADWQGLTDGLKKDLEEAQTTIDELKHTVRFLSDTNTKWKKCRNEAIQLRGEEVRDHLKFHWPVVQGTHNNQIVKQVGEQPFDGEKASRGFAHMLDRGEQS